MGEIVGAFGIPHNPHFPGWVAQGTELADEIQRLYRPLADGFERLRPDALIYITSDHYNLFWETLPTFAIGVAEGGHGASDYPELDRWLPIDAALARQINEHLMRSGFDVAVLQELAFDHTVIAPLHFLMPDMEVPLVPVYVSAFVRPLPSARRCLELGRAIAEAVRSAAPSGLRVAVAGTGSFSLEIGGSRISEDTHTGVPDPQWLERVCALVRAGDVEHLLAEATDEQLWRAGSAGGELLDWITMLGTFPAGPPEYLEVQPQFGHAFAAWSLAPASGSRPAQAPELEPARACYAVDSFCRRVVHDPELRRRLGRDPARALRTQQPALPEDQIEALLAGDVGTLARMGANPFLLHQLGRWRVLGLDLPTYAARIREAYRAERAGHG